METSNGPRKQEGVGGLQKGFCFVTWMLSALGFGLYSCCCVWMGDALHLLTALNGCSQLELPEEVMNLLQQASLPVHTVLPVTAL